jgi:hypothetical protein
MEPRVRHSPAMDRLEAASSNSMLDGLRRHARKIMYALLISTGLAALGGTAAYLTRGWWNGSDEAAATDSTPQRLPGLEGVESPTDDQVRDAQQRQFEQQTQGLDAAKQQKQRDRFDRAFSDGF